MKKFPRKQIETAVDVLSQSKMVQNWVKSMSDFTGVDLTTDAGKTWYENKCREVAKHLLK